DQEAVPVLRVRGFRMTAVRLTLAAALLVAAGAARADDPRPEAKQYDEQIRPLLAKFCLDCHGGEKPKGDFRLDKLSPDFADAATQKQWQAVLSRVRSGEMPPKGKPRPEERDVRVLADWIAGRAAQGRTVLRRLNRVEYENTV